MRHILRSAAAGLVLCGGIAACPGLASAHAFLASAVPAVGSTVHGAPTQVAIEFTESVEPDFSTIAVQDAGGAPVKAGAAHLAGAGTRLAVDVGALAPGGYTVVWHAVSTDTHRTEGRYSFTVVP